MAIRIGGDYNQINIGVNTAVAATHSDVIISTADHTRIDVAGEIAAQGNGGGINRGIWVEGDNALITIRATGSIGTGICLTDGPQGASTCPPGANASSSHGIHLIGANAEITHEGSITTRNRSAAGIAILNQGSMQSGARSLLTTRSGSFIITEGVQAHGVFIDRSLAGHDAPLDLNLAGEIRGQWQGCGRRRHSG